MTDAEGRWRVLARLHELRDSGTWVHFSQLADLGLDKNQVGRFLEQLKQKNLISGTIKRSSRGPGYFAVMVQINVHGSDVIEKPDTADRGFLMVDRSVHFHGPAQNVQIGDNNQQSMTISLEKLNEAIDNTDGTNEQKEEAKSLGRKLLESPLLPAIVRCLVASGFGG